MEYKNASELQPPASIINESGNPAAANVQAPPILLEWVEKLVEYIPVVFAIVLWALLNTEYDSFQHWR